jgi:quinol monooxygenase YgiN
MQKIHMLHHLSITVLLLVLSSCAATQNKTKLVRLAVIEVEKTQLRAYNELLKEEIDDSIEKEPGVITLYAIAEKENPERVTLFETYADSAQYRAHLATPHFQKYKQGTLQMVKHLELIETEPLLYHRKAGLSSSSNEHFFIRLIKMELNSNAIGEFEELARTVMLPGLKDEKGVLVMYAVSEKKKPTHVSILEVYADSAAYESHLKTPHFLKYKEGSKGMVSSLKLTDVMAVQLGSKPL